MDVVPSHRTGSTMRGLDPTFLDHLQSGWLLPLLARVLADRTLDLQIRDDYLNVYYRGGNLLRLTRAGDTYDALGLIDVGKDLSSFSDELPIFLFILANHDPDKTRLREDLATLPTAQHCEVRVATSSLMGYSLYDPWIRTVDEVLALPPTML